MQRRVGGGGPGEGETNHPWNPGTLEPWYPGTLEPWYPGTLEPWNPGTLEPWNPGTLVPWNPGTLVPCKPPLEPRHDAGINHVRMWHWLVGLIWMVMVDPGDAHTMPAVRTDHQPYLIGAVI